ncbi:hypothetical protein TNCV_84651 [Trichonephila clavipes]|nr:hypothetical protein TNCV_84651 [Trichonephila clavipes]
MGLYERKSAVLDGDFEWVCSTITSQNIYGRTPMILLTMRPSRLFVKIRCHAVASTRKRSAVRNYMRAIGHGPRNFERRSSDKKDMSWHPILQTSTLRQLVTVTGSILVPLKTRRVEELMHVKSVKLEVHCLT